MIRWLFARWLSFEIDPAEWFFHPEAVPSLDHAEWGQATVVTCAGPMVVGCVDWIDGEDEDDDENAREGFNEPTESEPDDADEE